MHIKHSSSYKFLTFQEFNHLLFLSFTQLSITLLTFSQKSFRASEVSCLALSAHSSPCPGAAYMGKDIDKKKVSN